MVLRAPNRAKKHPRENNNISYSAQFDRPMWLRDDVFISGLTRQSPCGHHTLNTPHESVVLTISTVALEWHKSQFQQTWATNATTPTYTNPQIYFVVATTPIPCCACSKNHTRLQYWQYVANATHIYVMISFYQAHKEFVMMSVHGPC